MKRIKLIALFLIINFGALAIGSWLMAEGPQGNWYMQLQKAPWTPKGWVFGAAWTSIMICFSVYMSMLYLKRPTKKVITLFSVQWILNVSWNAVFFELKLIDLGLAVIVALTLIITAFLLTYFKDLKLRSLLILPYLIWLCIATSLNLYISVYN